MEQNWSEGELAAAGPGLPTMEGTRVALLPGTHFTAPILLASSNANSWVRTPTWRLSPALLLPLSANWMSSHSLTRHPTSEIKFHLRASVPAAKDPGELSFLGFYLGAAGLPGQRFPRHSKSDQRRWAAWKCKQCLFQQFSIYNGFTQVQVNSPNLVLTTADL